MVVNQGGNTYDIVLNTASATFTQDAAAAAERPQRLEVELSAPSRTI